MLVALGGKCLAGIAKGLRKKFTPYAVSVSRLDFEMHRMLMANNYLQIWTNLCYSFLDCAMYPGEIQGEETDGCGAPAGVYRCCLSMGKKQTFITMFSIFYETYKCVYDTSHQ